MPRQKNFRRTALITGASQRIGQAIALHLAHLGYDIALHYSHSAKETEQTKAAVIREGRQCYLFKCDFMEQAATQSLITQVLKKAANLNVLINNASVFNPSSLTEYNLADLEKQFAINFKAPYILSCEFAENCETGQIINILDTHIVNAATGYTNYLLSKKALGELTKLAAHEFAPRIRVNGVAPGLILPPKNKTKAYLGRLAKSLPLKRQGSVKNITQSIEFLLKNDYLTGEIIFNDGGEHLL